MPDEGDAAFLRVQAEKCRWLARQTADQKVARKLGYLAMDYDAQAAALDGGGQSNRS